MSKEFIWSLDFDGEIVDFHCVLQEGEVVTFENGQEMDHLAITNPESKQGVLQIDTIIYVNGQEAPFQLERNIPYIKLGNQWMMSATTFEERKQKLLKTQKIAAYAEVGICIALCLACLIKYLVTGSLGNWWFLIVMGTFVAGTGMVQYKEVKDQVAQLDEVNNT